MLQGGASSVEIKPFTLLTMPQGAAKFNASCQEHRIYSAAIRFREPYGSNPAFHPEKLLARRGYFSQNFPARA